MHEFGDFHFKRGNFFTGLMASPQFWNDIQDYHLHKELLYNKLFHGIGVVPGVMEEMKVSPMKKGGNITIVISPGMSIDGNGRPLFLYQPQAMVVDYKKYQLPTTLYVVIYYNEALDEYYQNRENPEYQGYQKKVETSIIEITTKKPDNHAKMEIARIYLEEDENGEIPDIKEPENFADPAANEVDTRFVSWASLARKGLSPNLRKYLIDVLEETKLTAAQANDAVSLAGLRELITISITAKMLVECDNVSFDNIINILHPIYEINLLIIQEMLDIDRVDEKRTFSSKEAFDIYRVRIHEMGDLIKYFDNSHGSVDKIIKCLQLILEKFRLIIETKKITYNTISLISYDLPRVLVVDEERYTLVEYLDFKDHNTEAKFQFSTDAKDYLSANQQFTYPDGTSVKDVVKRYAEGKISFVINNVVKKRELLMIRRMDIFHGNFAVDVELNGDVVNQIIVDGYDSKNRWRNIATVFDEDLITQETNTVSFVMGKNGRDNFGKIWFYQKI